MTLLVRNEIDVLRENIEFHLSKGVDYIIATDNGSRDGTRELLEEYQRLNVMRIFDEPDQDFAQGKWVTRMALAARDEHGAEWILNNDADEFWHPREGNLKQDLALSSAEIHVCRRRNYLYAYDAEDGDDWRKRVVNRVVDPLPLPSRADPVNEKLPCPFLYFDLPPKVLIRARGLVSIDQGNHDARFDFTPWRAASTTFIRHYPVRSADQFRRKILQGGAAYARNADLPSGMGWHWRRWYRMLQQGQDREVFAEMLPDSGMLAQGLKTGRIVQEQYSSVLSAN